MKIDDLVMHETTGEIFTVEDIVGDWAEVSDILKPKVKMTIKKSKLMVLPPLEVDETPLVYANPTKPLTVLKKDKENPNVNRTTTDQRSSGTTR